MDNNCELSFLEVKPAGKLFIDYPRTRKRIKELLKRISKDDIIGVIEKAKADGKKELEGAYALSEIKCNKISETAEKKRSEVIKNAVNYLID